MATEPAKGGNAPGLSYQRPAILDRIDYRRHAVIEASAGTGKTYVIEHLFADLVRVGACPPEQALVVTFTEKATGELRARVRSILERIVRGEPEAEKDGHQTAPLDPKALDRLYAALASFERVPIFTIHGFCQRVLADFAFLTGTNFAPEVVESRGAFHRALRNELRDNHASSERARELLADWMRSGGTVGAFEDILYQGHRRRYLDREPPARREDTEHLLSVFDRSVLEDAYREAAITGAARESALAELGKLDATIQSCGSPKDLIGRLHEIDLRAIVSPRGVRVGKRTKPFPEGLSEKAQEELRRLEALHIVALGIGSPEGKLLDSCLPAVEERLAKEKREAGQIDYDDMLALVWQAIDGPGGGKALAAALRARYRYALLDEFQDTDDLQWRIFRRLFLEGSGGNVLYVVGDPKQAIYAFRGADVFTYLEAKDELGAAGVEPVRLRRNFRSTPAMVRALNRILDQEAAAPLFDGEIRYDFPVECGRPELSARAGGRNLVPVTLMRYRPAPGAKFSAPAARETIGRHIAATLRRLLNDPAHRIRIAAEDGASREVEAKDVFVLTRSHAESEELGRYLREADVPFAFYKKEGLFQTAEAGDVLDLLRAVEEPADGSRRLKAWTTPFFAVRFRDLATLGTPPPDHPLAARLYAWSRLAEREQFAELFERVLHESGLVDRELFLSDSERELTNYLHIFEILLEQARARRLSLAEIVALLCDYIAGRDEPPGGNVQRIESERHAVQVMTVHMSKGLEADVVVLYGGFGKGGSRDAVRVYHRGRRVRFAVGAQRDQALVKGSLGREEAEENQRLLYVGITRARAKLYLPLIPEENIGGYYAALNARLGEIASGLDNAPAGDEVRGWFSVEDAGGKDGAATVPTVQDSDLASWSPPAALLDGARDAEARDAFLRIAPRHAAPPIRSYTSLHALAEAASEDTTADEFKADIVAAEEGADLAGGRNVGIFLHEVIEKLDMNSFDAARDLDSWKAREDVRALFSDGMRRHRVRDPRWTSRGPEIVYNTLTASIASADGEPIGPLWSLRSLREMEFICPMPERPILGSAAPDERWDGRWKVESGYLKGFVDFVFERHGIVYFADWKSDLLPSYDAETIRKHVGEHYELQARIYCVGVMRLLRILGESEYRRRFGGLLYVFLRGMRPGGDGREGVYFHRPTWAEILAYEKDLMRIAETVRR